MKKKAVNFTPELNIASLPLPPSKKSSDYLKAYKGWAYSAITQIAQKFASVPIKLYKKRKVRNDIEIEEVNDHEALALLENANDFMTFEQLKEIYSTYMDLLGEASWILIRSGKQIEQIWPLRPDWIDIVPSTKQFIDHYEYKPGGSFKAVNIDTEDLIWFKNFSPDNPYRGFGRIRAGAMSIDIDDFSDDWNRAFFFNSAIPYMFLSTDAKLSKESITRFREEFDASFRGRNKAHKVSFMAGGKLDVNVIGNNMKEMDYLESKKFLRDQILSTFNMSKSSIGIVDDVNRANQEAGDARFMRDIIKPRLITFVGFLNEFYLKEWPNEGLFFNFEDPVQTDKEMDLKIYESGLKNGWLTINEVRESEGLVPVDGGDAIYLPFNLQAIGEASGDQQKGAIKLQKQKTEKKSKFKFAAPIPGKSLREIRAGKLSKEIKSDVLTLIKGLMSGYNTDKKKMFTEEEREFVWKQMVAKTDVFEVKVKTILDELTIPQEKEVLSNINKFGDKAFKDLKIKATPTSFLFSLKKENSRWKSALLGYITSIVADKLEETLKGLGGDVTSDLILRITEDYINTDGFKFVNEVNTVTRKQLSKELREGLRLGEGIDDLSKRIRNVYDKFTKTRSEVIARTETLRATNFGTEAGYKESGVVTGKEWLTALDERACPYCSKLNGKIIDIEGDFFKKGDEFQVEDQKLKIGLTDVSYPPLHPQCRCTLIPVIVKGMNNRIISKDEAIDLIVDKVNNKTAQK